MTDTTVALVDMSSDGLQARITYAEHLAQSGLLPESYRHRPANVLVAIETGGMLGIHPIAALTGVNVIQGKPTLSPGLMTALVRRAGHKVRVKTSGSIDAGDYETTVTVVRHDDPDEPFTSTWSMRRAERAQLGNVAVREDGSHYFRSRTEKGHASQWEKYTEAMLQHRAESEACRAAAEDVLMGAHYTPDELGASVDAQGDYIEGEIVEKPKPTPPKPTPTPPPAPEPTDVEVADAENVAELAMLSLDVEQVRRLYQQAGRTNIAGIDVSKVVPAQARAALNIPEGDLVQLGHLLMAVGARLNAGRGPLVTAPADAAPTDTNDTVDADVVVDDDVPLPPPAT